jgi:hypothetical protein
VVVRDNTCPNYCLFRRTRNVFVFAVFCLCLRQGLETSGLVRQVVLFEIYKWQSLRYTSGPLWDIQVTLFEIYRWLFEVYKRQSLRYTSGTVRYTSGSLWDVQVALFEMYKWHSSRCTSGTLRDVQGPASVMNGAEGTKPFCHPLRLAGDVPSYNLPKKKGEGRYLGLWTVQWNTLSAVNKYREFFDEVSDCQRLEKVSAVWSCERDSPFLYSFVAGSEVRGNKNSIVWLEHRCIDFLCAYVYTYIYIYIFFFFFCWPDGACSAWICATCCSYM